MPEKRDVTALPLTCPVGCGLPLGDDRLYADWYAPMEWWVVYHVQAHNIEAFEALAKQGPGAALFEFAYCARADMDLPEGTRIIGREAHV